MLFLIKSSNHKECIRRKVFLDKWRLPLKSLKFETTFANRPVLKSPKLMMLECFLFNDVNQSIKYHLNSNHKVCETDDKRFSMLSIKRGAKDYLRILGTTSNPTSGFPASKFMFKMFLNGQ